MASILVVDDDRSSCETFERILRLAGYEASSTTTPDAALAITRERSPDLLLLDYRLGNTTGLDLLRRLRVAGCQTPFILVTAFATTQLTVEAMRRGALNVLDYPVDPNKLENAVLEAMLGGVIPRLDLGEKGRFGSLSPLSVHSHAMGSAADRLGRHILRACAADQDLASMGKWAAHNAASRTSLYEICWLAGVKGRDARNFARMCRAFRRASWTGSSVESFLVVGDRGTLKRLLDTSGNVPQATGVHLMIHFLQHQQFVPKENPVFLAVCLLLDAADAWARWAAGRCKPVSPLRVAEEWEAQNRLVPNRILSTFRILEITSDDALSVTHMLWVIRKAMASGEPVGRILKGGAQNVANLANQIDRLDEAEKVPYFLRHQSFIPTDNPGLQALCAAMAV